MHRKTPVSEFLFKACNFIKKDTLAQVFSCEFWEILKNTFFYNTSGGCFCEKFLKEYNQDA